MKKIAFAFVLIVTAALFSAYLKNIPMSVTQPDGSVLNLFATGDEFFNRLHDGNDFTIVQGSDGWYYYGFRSGDDVAASAFRAGQTYPESAGLTKGAKISEKLYREKVESFNVYKKFKSKDAPTTGSINNLVIFIRFSDEASTVFQKQRSYYDNYFNTTGVSSLKDYFDEVSYNKLDVTSSYYPHVDDFTTNLSYQDIYPRAYYQPYNATTNPTGYTNDSQSTEREHSLLERAVAAIAAEVPTSLNIDADNDGNVDNVIFLVSGAPGAWASLLWPHMWYLYTRDVIINKKKVANYNFDLTGTSTYFTVGVICHEFFHTLGGPDLYHYYDSTSPDAVGAWDVMNDTSNPPQYMGAWMKYKYMNWIESCPTISAPGTYTLNPLTSPAGNIFRINSPGSLDEFFIVEYRKQTGLYEVSLPGSDDGMLIYRINSAYYGNADGPPDEVYIYRPGGTTVDWGNLNKALFSKDLFRTEFNFATDPYPFLTNGSEGGINITNIGYAAETISFDIALNVLPPKNIIFAVGYGSIELNWAAPDPVAGYAVSHYKVYRNNELIADNITGTRYIDGTVIESTTYEYSVSAYYTGAVVGESAVIKTDSLTFRSPYPAPYSTNFSEQTDWTQLSTDCTPRWISSSITAYAGGSSPEIIAEDENSNPALSRFVSPAVSTTGIDTLRISFKHYYDAYEAGVNYKVQISPNRFEWTDTPWSFSATDVDAGPETAVIDLTVFPDPVYISWTLEGNLWGYDAWYLDDILISSKIPTSIGENNLPNTTGLKGSYPNPFNPETTILFDLSENSNIKLNIYDVKGSLVRTLLSGNKKAGSYSVRWDGRDDRASQIGSGIYYIRLETGKDSFINKLMMIK